MDETVDLGNTRNERGSFYRALRLRDDGSLVIVEQDLGRGVSDFWGAEWREYEFARTLAPPAVAQLRTAAALGDSNLLQALRSRFETSALGTFLRDHGIETTFWSASETDQPLSAHPAVRS